MSLAFVSVSASRIYFRPFCCGNCSYKYTSSNDRARFWLYLYMTGLDNPLMLLRNVVAAEPARSGFGKIKKSICQSILSKHNPIQSTYVVAVDCKGS